MSRALIAVWILGLSALQAAEPPLPNPKQPVDYVKWANEEYGKDITDNAAPQYREAIAAFRADDEMKKLATETDAAAWTAAQRDQLRRWVEGNAACLEKFTAGAGKGKCFFELKSPSGSVIEVALPELAGLRNISLVLAVRGRLSLLSGKADGAVDDAVIILQASQHLQTQPFLIGYLTGLAVGAQGYALLRDVPRLATAPVDYQRAADQLKRFDREPLTPARQLAAEKVFAWDSAQRYLRDADNDGAYESLELPAALKDIPKSSRLAPAQKFDRIAKEIGEYYDQWVPLFSADWQNARATGAALEKRLAEQKGSILSVLGAALSGTVRMHRRLSADRNACRIIFELHACKAKNGRWPATLDEGLSQSVARKALDPFSGQAFVYRVKNGEPLLYCVSQNGTDDGGEVFRKDGKATWGDTGDYVFWPHQKN